MDLDLLERASQKQKQKQKAIYFPSKMQLGEYILKWPVFSCSSVTYLTIPVVACGIIRHHRTFGSYCMVCQFAVKLNLAVNEVQET